MGEGENSGSKPVNHRSKLNKSEKSFGQFLVASADTTMSFYPAEEVLNPMAIAIICSVERNSPATPPFRRNTYPRALQAKSCAERIGIKSLVCYCPFAPQKGYKRVDCVEVVTLTSSQGDRNRVATTFDHGGQLSIEPASSETDCLGGLPTTRVGAILVEFDMGTVNVPQFAFGLRRGDSEHSTKDAVCAPTSEAGID
jgi:hypothetical protein